MSEAGDKETSASERGTSTLRVGYLLLAVTIPFGVVLEALHGFKVEAFMASEMRRELFRLAHAHGAFLGILCLVYGALSERRRPPDGAKPEALAAHENEQGSASFWLATGAVLMPVGFFLGGILNSEGDPSLGIVLVPVGAACLVVALYRAAAKPPR